jgi:TolB-like protein/DNA-binding winged helix-turn-helix (wHTH) protein/Tfp pilus assembly protein PilF
MNQDVSPKPVRSVRFGVFEVDLKAGEVRKNGLKVKLQEQPFQVLSVLLEQAGEVVTREELRQKLWPRDTFVDFDHGLNAAVRKLRQALGDPADNPLFVETVARRGYRFIAPLGTSLDGVKAADPETTGRVDSGRGIESKSPSRLTIASLVLAFVVIAFGLSWITSRKENPFENIKRLAILPFSNASGDPEVEYLSDGITEGLINRFSRLGQLQVIPRATAFRYKHHQLNLTDVGRRLGVDALLTGRVLQRGNILNIQAELISMTDGTQLWGEQYERDLAALIEVQEQLSRDIAARLQLTLTDGERKQLVRSYTQNTQAHGLYLRGMHFWNKRTESAMHKAIEYFQQAVEKDPEYALAYAMLSDSYSQLGDVFESISPREMLPKAQAAAVRAVSIDDSLAEGHMILAEAKFGYEWDWGAAERGYRRAIELDSKSPIAHQRYSNFLTALGRTEESLREISRAIELDPVSFMISTSLGRRLYSARRYDEAIHQFKKTLELDSNFAPAHYYLGKAYIKASQFDEALAAFKQAHAYSKLSATAMEGYILARSGQKEKARLILNELKRRSTVQYVSPYHLAIIHTGLRENDEALSSLRQACDDRAYRIVFLGSEPLFDDLRNDSRFQALLNRIGLPALDR